MTRDGLYLYGDLSIRWAVVQLMHSVLEPVKKKYNYRGSFLIFACILVAHETVQPLVTASVVWRPSSSSLCGISSRWPWMQQNLKYSFGKASVRSRWDFLSYGMVQVCVIVSKRSSRQRGGIQNIRINYWRIRTKVGSFKSFELDESNDPICMRLRLELVEKWAIYCRGEM
jgi:hypothetical protein